MTAATQPTEKRSRSFRPDIQGLRAIAVLLVVVYHAGAPVLTGGYVGVDVFFVISGFLITTHLLQSLATTGRIRFGRFYARRARRILPASLLVAVLIVLASWIWMPPLQMSQVWQGAKYTAIYLPNKLFADQETDYLAEETPSVFQHYWSLGIEEQFYLLWPAVLALGFWLCRHRERRLFAMVAAVTLASFVLCVVGMAESQPRTFFSPFSRGWELGVGGLVAFLLRGDARWLSRPVTGLLAWLGLALLAVAAIGFDATTPFPGYHALLPVAATALLIIGGNAPGGLHAGRLLDRGAFQLLGAISYSLYLVHWPLQVIPQASVGYANPLPLWLTLLLGAAAVPLAWALYRFVERPALSWSPLADRKPVWTGAAAVAASMSVILVAGGSYWLSTTRDLTTGETVASTPVELHPRGTEFVPANLTPTLRGAVHDNSEIYSNGCHQTLARSDAGGCRSGANPDAPLVYLFGDSHAATWHPALQQLADEGLIRLDSNTKSSCPSAAVEAVLAEGMPYPDCHTWRGEVIDRINAEQPDLVLLANYGNSPLLAAQDDHPSTWQAGLESIIEAMPGVPVAVLADVPFQGDTPANCLSANLRAADRCAAGTGEAFAADVVTAEQAATAATGATYLDFSPYLCNEETCPTIIGSTLVYRDAHHLTASFSRQLSGPLGESLAPLLP